jgi:hypothetical protein
MGNRLQPQVVEEERLTVVVEACPAPEVEEPLPVETEARSS